MVLDPGRAAQAGDQRGFVEQGAFERPEVAPPPSRR